MTDPRFRLAEALRRLNEEIATSTADPSLSEDAAEMVEQIVARFAAGPHEREYIAGREGSVVLPHERGFIANSPIAGEWSPVAPPIRMRMIDNGAVGEGVFGMAYEGPPRCVHGGVVAATYDEVLGFAQGVTGMAGMTGRLLVNYRSPTPLYEQLRFTAVIDRVEGRKIFVKADCVVVGSGRLCSEAEGLFITMRPELWAELKAAREAERAAGEPPPA